MQYDATGDKQWLTAAEQSFRASLSLEGKPIGQGDPPAQLLQQPWWMTSGQRGSEDSVKPPAAPTATKGSTRQPAGTPAKPHTTAASKPAAITARKPPSTTANKPAASRANKPASNTAVKQAAVRQPAAATKPAGRGRPQAVAPNKPQAMTGKSVATLGDLKAGAKQPETSKQASLPANQQSPTAAKSPISTTSVPSPPPATTLNQSTHHPRLGLARVLSKQTNGKPSEECSSLYQEVIKMSPDVHDAYIELGELLARSDPLAAVGIYSKFPFSDPPSFDDAYLHGEIVRILMASESYDDPRLSSSMVAMGRALGITVLDRHVSTLEAKFKTNLLKQVYAGVHQKKIDDPDLQAFFKFKCWT